jgi:RNA polymerase sigma-70 factor (ECF subfamily)
LYVDLYRVAWETAYAYVRSDDTAEDVVHDVFLQIWADRGRWRVHGSVRAYLLSAIRHKAMNVLRHERVVRRDAERDAAMGSAGVLGERPLSPDAVVRTNDLHEALEAALATFPALRRDVVVLRWRQGLSVSEIAQVVGISANAVSIHLTRAREVLLPLLREVAG